MRIRVLILCTGNSCRSQMAEGFMKTFDSTIDVFSAGMKPAQKIHPLAVSVMKELGIDISGKRPKNVDTFTHESFDYVITVCDNAKESCPVFLGKVTHKLHFGFEDPAEATGTEEEVSSEFRRIRDEIKKTFYNFTTKTITKN